MQYDIIQIVSSIMEANCYLIKCNNKCIIVDPCVDVQILKRYEVKEVEAVLITHSHVDHIYCLKEIVNEYNPTIYLSGKGLSMIYNDNLNLSNYFNKGLKIKEGSFKYKIVNDNQIIIDELKIKCISTPGHTIDSVSFLLNDDLFTGDTLFDRSIGRTDFPTGDSLKMRESLKKIMSINDNLTIYPGHNNITTLKEQKNKNYYLQF